MNENVFSIRPASIDDLEQVLKIENRAHPCPWTVKQFEEELSKMGHHFLVFTDDETDAVVAGYIVFHDLGVETYILNVAVGLDWRGLGMGRRLVSYAINHAYREKHQRIFLEVRVENKAATDLYRKLGFQEGGIRQKFYSDGADALFMELVPKAEGHLEQGDEFQEMTTSTLYH